MFFVIKSRKKHLHQFDVYAFYVTRNCPLLSILKQVQFYSSFSQSSIESTSKTPDCGFTIAKLTIKHLSPSPIRLNSMAASSTEILSLSASPCSGLGKFFCAYFGLR